MPTKIKALWWICSLVIIVGFIVLSYQTQMEKVKAQAQADRAKQFQAQKTTGPDGVEMPRAIFSPIKEIKELNALGKHQEAIDMAEIAASIRPNNAKVQMWWGISLVKAGKRGEAIKKFVRAADLDSTEPKTFLYWGLTLSMKGKFEEAISKYEVVVGLDPENSNAFAYWGAALNQKGNFSEAIEKLQKSLDFNPINPIGFDGLIQAYTGKGDYGVAWDWVARARKDNISLPKDTVDNLAGKQPEPS
jgi:tetratricopeptide (TPR) repeat protein